MEEGGFQPVNSAAPGDDQLNPRRYPLAGKRDAAHKTVVTAGSTAIGGGRFTIIAGPCAIESYAQTAAIASAIATEGLGLMRGGAFKPRTSPYSFQGLRHEGLDIIARIKAETGLLSVTELMSIDEMDSVCAVADIIQLGSRNMQNFPLLHAAGKQSKPILLKRGFGNTLQELLMAAEHVMSEGNTQVILCERGIRTFDHSQRNTLDLMAVPILKSVSHLPVIVDPSHSVGMPELIPSAIKAALVLGADGVLVEVHPEPAAALSDGAQSLTIEQFHQIVAETRKLASLLSRDID
jgi:3-deoxy-7-phosphoheptulonate synthase